MELKFATLFKSTKISWNHNYIFSCLWNVSAPLGFRIRLKFLSPVILQEPMDTLTIFNGKRVVDRLHGYISFPKEYESVNNNLYVELDSAPHDLREGFFAQVSLIKSS